MESAYVSLGQFQKYFLCIFIPAKDQNDPCSSSLNCERYTSGIGHQSFSVESFYEFHTHLLSPNFFLEHLRLQMDSYMCMC